MTGLGAGCGVRMGWLADGIEGKVEGEDAASSSADSKTPQKMIQPVGKPPEVRLFLYPMVTV